MRILLTNLSDSTYSASRKRLNDSAICFGVNEVLSYDFEDIKKSEFYNSNKEILDCPKGIGYWLWKPYIIIEAMKKLEDGDIVIYSDCGIEIIKSLDPLINIVKNKEPVLLFGNGNFPNAMWTKRDSFILMDCDTEQYWFAPHCDASFSIFKKCDLSINFLTDWLNYGKDERIITDLPNTCELPNLNEFKEHRWDQSIISLLAQKYHFHLYRMPSQFGNHYKIPELRLESEFNCLNQLDQSDVNYYSIIPYYNSNYGQLLNHHREKFVQKCFEIEPDITKTEKPKSVKGSQAKKVIKSIAAKMALKLKNI